MEITIQQQSVQTRSESDKKISRRGYMVRHDKKVLGFCEISGNPDIGSGEEEKAYLQAYKQAQQLRIDYITKSAGISSMNFTIGTLKGKKFVDESDPENPKVTFKNGFILRGSDNKFAVWSESQKELQDIIDSIKTGKTYVPQEKPSLTKQKEERTPEEITEEKRKRAERDKKYREKIKAGKK